MTRHPEAIAALHAAKSLSNWGVYATLRFVQKNSKVKLFLLALKLELQHKNKLLWEFYTCQL